MKQKKEALEAMREEVMAQELSTRSWKAHFEKMYYTLEAEKIEKEYEECQERMRTKLQEQQEVINKLNQAVKEAVDGVDVEQ